MTDDASRRAPPSVMIVDDTVENLRLLQSMLKEAGYNVRPAPSGALALRAAEKAPPDVILLDITMPEMSGFETCKRLKEIESLKDVPVIFISALDEADDKVKAYQAGGVDFVTKPFRFEEVHARVETQLKLCAARKALESKNRELAQALSELELARAVGVSSAGVPEQLTRYIEAHGGTTEIQETSAQGTVIRVTLPSDTSGGIKP